MQWLWANAKEPTKAMAPDAKLRAFHELAKDAIERAYQFDVAGDGARATKLYATGLDAINLALELQVHGTGLGPKADSISSLKHDLQQWQKQVIDRLRFLESDSASSNGGGSKGGSRSGAEPVRPKPNLALSIKAVVPVAAGAIQWGAAGSASRGRAPSSGGGGQMQKPPVGGVAAKTRSIEDLRFREMVLGEVLDKAPKVTWDDIADLKTAKQALNEAVVLPNLRADIFQGLRAPIRGILLYGPPGNGKTLLGRALASEAKATFFSISASSLTSKWVGEGEKLVRCLFEVASEQAPSIIFIDEIDSILSARTSSENDAMRRLKTEFLVQYDGVAGGDDRVVVIGATNRPYELDDAVRRRLVKRIYIPLPSNEGRKAILGHLLNRTPSASALSKSDIERVVKASVGYSASDLTALCKESAMGPIRELGAAISSIDVSNIRKINITDFAAALNVIKPSVNKEALDVFEDFTREFGTS